MGVFIKGISYYLPDRIVSNEELVKDFPEWSVEKVASKIGIKQRHIAASDQTSADMAVAAGEKLISEYNLDRNIIDFVIFCTQSPDYFLPASACIIQEKLGLPTNIGAIDINQGCSGFIYGLSLAKGLICGGIAKNVLLLTAETYSKYIHPKDKSNRTIFGDAAAATFIAEDGFAELLEFSLGTDGRGAKNLIVETGGLRCAGAMNKITWDEGGNPSSPDHLYMDGTEIFNFTLNVVPKLVKDLLLRNNMQKEEIGLFILHQANRYMMEFLRKKIKIDPEQFYYYIENVGNTVSSTIPVALKEAVNDGSAAPAMNILVAGFGVGYSWGGTILRF